MKSLLAIDPGKNGGIAWRTSAGDIGFKKCPEGEQAMVELLHSVAPHDEALIEQVRGGVFAPPGPKCPTCGLSKSKVGAKSQFNFGRNFGTWLGIMSGLAIPFREIPPKAWQSGFPGLPKDSKERKAEVHRRVQNRWPHLKSPKYLADALAILSVMIDRETRPAPVPVEGTKEPAQPDLFGKEDW